MGKIINRVVSSLIVVIATTCIAFADISNVGQNFGNFVTEQIFWIALAVVTFVCLQFLLKKAWIPLFIFIMIAGIVLYIIGAPEQLKGIGETLFKIFVQ